MIELKGKLEKRVSKKTNTEYVVLVVTFPNGYSKTVFLEDAELFMLGSK